MRSERTLLERIDAAASPEAQRATTDLGAAVDSVIGHLRRMLNVRQGSVETLPGYGMPDFNDILNAHRDHISVLQRTIRDMVTAYEPRLTDVRVGHLPNEDDPLDLRFKITARLRLDGEDTSVEIETLVGDGGRMDVRG